MVSIQLAKRAKILILCILCFTPMMLFAQQYENKNKNLSELELYHRVTSLTMAFNEKYGKKFRLPVNAKNSVNLILKNSDSKRYMGSRTYNDYSQSSQFAKDANNMMAALVKLVNDFKDIGFIKAIKSQGMTPALMFDIDNTIELTSFDDDYWTKSGINDPATVHFIKSVCFKDGIACYFITARTCNKNEAIATKNWLKKHLGLSDKQVRRYVFLSGSIPDNACTSKPHEKVAYKDVLRQALTEMRHVYWLMSIGDQMTDWFGKDSGLKVWYPNEMFDSSIVPNNGNNPKKKGVLLTVVAPTQKCYEKLKSKALTHSTIKYCQAFKANHYIS